MTTTTIICIVVAIVILVVIIWCIVTSNAFNRLQVKIDEAESDIDVALQKRHDVLMKMLDVVKGYAKHEVDTFSKVVELRSDMTMLQKQEVQEQQTATLDRINLLAEQYPQLRSSENYQMLQGSINNVEEHLQAARRLFNGNVSLFNQKLVTFPASIIGKSIKHLSPREFFEADEDAHLDVKMNLS